MRRLTVGTLVALAGAVFITTSGVSGQGKVDSPGVIAADGSGPAPGSYKGAQTRGGEPDLQGTFNANDLQGIPMARAQSVGTRYKLSDGEVKQRGAERDHHGGHAHRD